MAVNDLKISPITRPPHTQPSAMPITQPWRANICAHDNTPAVLSMFNRRPKPHYNLT